MFRMGKAGVGWGALVLVMLVAPSALALPPAGSPSARVKGLAAPSPSNAAPSAARTPARKWPVVIDVSIAAGPSLARSKARYDPFESFGLDEPPSSPSFDDHSAVSPGAALTLSVGGRLGSRLMLGGALALMATSMPNRFTGERSGVTRVSFGPELALRPAVGGGVFVFVRGGYGHLNHSAWSTTCGGGYAFHLGESEFLGLGLELSSVYSRFAEDGDHGTYTYKDKIVAPAVVARLGVF